MRGLVLHCQVRVFVTCRDRLVKCARVSSPRNRFIMCKLYILILQQSVSWKVHKRYNRTQMTWTGVMDGANVCNIFWIVSGTIANRNNKNNTGIYIYIYNKVPHFGYIQNNLKEQCGTNEKRYVQVEAKVFTLFARLYGQMPDYTLHWLTSISPKTKRSKECLKHVV